MAHFTFRPASEGTWLITLNMKFKSQVHRVALVIQSWGGGARSVCDAPWQANLACRQAEWFKQTNKKRQFGQLRMWGKGISHPLLMGLQTCTKSVWWFPGSWEWIYLKIKLCHSWTYIQRSLWPTTETLAQLCSMLFYSKQSELANILDAHQQRTINQERVVHLHSGILFSH